MKCGKTFCEIGGKNMENLNINLLLHRGCLAGMSVYYLSGVNTVSQIINLVGRHEDI